MATKNPRINITLEKTSAQLLATLAKKKHKSISNVARELILDALERQEDLYFSALADARDADETSPISHKDVWK